MNKFFSICLLAAIIVCASAFSAKSLKPASSNEKPELMLNVSLTQTGPGEATGAWTSTSGGPFGVTLTNLNTGQRVFFDPAYNGTSKVFTGLDTKTTYRLTVGDLNFLFDDELISF
ncbi:MAG TPA: hypothetical protein VK168_01890 [Saprospiraceae bacterium]|nr:hypothetical protein [Saprospiraceae bacterium]